MPRAERPSDPARKGARGPGASAAAALAGALAADVADRARDRARVVEEASARAHELGIEIVCRPGRGGVWRAIARVDVGTVGEARWEAQSVAPTGAVARLLQVLASYMDGRP